MRKIKVLCFIYVGLFGMSNCLAQTLWVEDFNDYGQGGVYWAYPDAASCPWVKDVAHSRIVSTGIGGNASAKYTGEPWYQAWNSRDFGVSIPAGQDVQVKARVTQALNGADPNAVGWPLSNHIFLSNIGIGIAGGKICYGILEYGYQASNTPRGYTTVATIDGEIWYDVKIVIHQIAGVNNDTADLYYKRSSDTNYTIIAAGINTGHDLDSKVHLHSYNYSDGRYKGYIDHIRLSSPPDPDGCDDVTVRLSTDLNSDCRVDFKDFSQLALQWLKCNNPGDTGCTD